MCRRVALLDVSCSPAATSTRACSPSRRAPAIQPVQRSMRLRASSETSWWMHDVGELQSAAGSQDAVDLVEHRVLVGHEVDDPVGDHDVDRAVGERELFDQRLVKLDVGQPHRRRARARAVEHRRSSCRCRSLGPDGPVICAAISRSVPAPQPRSSTTSPGSMPPEQPVVRDAGEALDASRSGTRSSSGSG